MTIKRGNKVKCIRDRNEFDIILIGIVQGNWYILDRDYNSNTNYYYIIDEFGDSMGYERKYFITLEQLRKETIESIINHKC